MGVEVILLGTVHLDLEARDCLLKLLSALEPECITVEISPFSVSFRALHQRTWEQLLRKGVRQLPAQNRGHARIRLLRRQIKFPFEWSAAREYAKKRGISCLAIDSEELAKRDLPVWEDELLSPDNLYRLVQTQNFDLETHFKRCYRYAERVLDTPGDILPQIHPLSWLSEPFWKRREQMLAERIRQISVGYRRVVHIGGWMHIVTGGPWKTVADFLYDLGPVRFLANPVLFLNREMHGISCHIPKQPASEYV